MRRPAILSFLLSLLSGYVDTAVFAYMGGLFVAHVTGNFVLLGVTLSGHGHAGAHGEVTTLQLLSFPLFVAAAGLAAVIVGRTGGGRTGTRTLFGLVALLFLAVGASALAGAERPLAGSLGLVVAMGFLNAAHRLEPSIGPPFTVMTGNVTGLAVGLARLARLAPADEAVRRASLLPTTLPIAGFLVGCAGGALAQSYSGLGSMVVPAAVMVIALVFAV